MLDPSRVVKVFHGTVEFYKINPAFFHDLKRDLHVKRFEKTIDDDWVECVKDYLIQTIEEKRTIRSNIKLYDITESYIPLNSHVFSELKTDLSRSARPIKFIQQANSYTLCNLLFFISFLFSSIIVGHLAARLHFLYK